MRLADLRHRFRFESDTGASSETTGEHTETISALCTRTAAFADAQDAQFRRMRMVYPQAQYGLVVRHDADTQRITPSHKARWIIRSRLFEILGPPIDPDEERKWLHVPLLETYPERALIP